jgi:hypothetical protein
VSFPGSYFFFALLLELLEEEEEEEEEALREFPEEELDRYELPEADERLAEDVA